MEDDSVSKFMTTSEVARELRLSAQTVHKLARSGEIPSFKVGPAYRFKRADIDQISK
jgi:excisionase family DNA binding protein